MVLIGLFALAVLWVAPAYADPISVGLLGLAAGSFAAATVNFAIATILSLALSFVAQTLLKPAARPTAAPGGESSPTIDNKITIRQAAAARQIVYGRSRQGGVYAFIHATDSNKYLHLIIVFAGHEIAGFDEIWINDQVVTLDGSGMVNAGTFINKARFKLHLGSATQTADTDLIAAAPDKWTTEHRLRGSAYLYVRLEFDGQVFSGGVPNISAVMRGKNDIYDPRTTTTGYSANPALCLANYLCDATYGVPVTYATGIDETALIAAANSCDETTNTKAGGTEARYSIDGAFLSSQQPQEIIGRLLGAMHGKAPYDGERWRIIAGVYQTPVLTFTDDDLRAGPRIQTLTSRRDTFNGVKGTYVGPDNNWQKADFPPVVSSTYQTLDGGQQIWKDIELPFTTSSSRAQRIAKIDLLRTRQQIAASMPCKLTAWRCQAGDTVLWTSDRYGWTAKPFEVASVRFAADESGDGGAVLAIDLELRETAAAVYDWATSEESMVDPAPNTNFPSVFNVLPAFNLTVVEELYATRDGAGVKTRATLAWSASVDAFVESYRVEYRVASGTYRKRPVTTGLSDTVEDIAPGSWEFRVIAVNSLGIDSNPVSMLKEITGLLARPSAPSNMSIFVSGGFGLLRWNQSADLDVRIGGAFVVKHSTLGVSTASWDTASAVLSAVPGSDTHATVPLMTGTYLAKFRDSSGLYSDGTAYATAVQSSTNWTTLASLIEDSAFTGTKTNCSVSSSKLKLTSGQLTGLYAFSAAINLGAIHYVRLTVNKTSAVVNNDAAWDSSAASDSTEPWDVVSPSGNEASSYVEYRSTSNNPASSPTWSAWALLDVAEVAGWGFEFRYQMTSTDVFYGIETSALAVVAQEAT